MDELPHKLRDLLEELRSVDSDTRGEILIELADTFTSVPPEVATPPYPEESRVPGCESEVFAFATNRSDGSRDYHFAVQNPQGISAKAMAAIIQQTLNGEPLSTIQALPQDIAYEIFGRTLSMGKGQGLMSMIGMVKALAAK